MIPQDRFESEMSREGYSGSRRVAFRIMYDGTKFNGWQRQPNGRTVQGELERILSRVAGDTTVNVVGAGRTDSGVHACGQVAHADISTRYADRNLLHAIRKMSPADIAIDGLITVPDDFHARYDAHRRSYRYRILRSPNPFAARFAWYTDTDLDMGLLEQGGGHMIGGHDFTGLSKHNPDALNPHCTVYQSKWSVSGNCLEYHIIADRFLYGMVRLVVGIQYDVARGARPIGDIPAVLEGAERGMQSPSVPARGLTLERVEYPMEPKFFKGEMA